MTFYNPIEILELKGVPSDQIDQTTIRKAKKRLLAEIELSENGSLSFNGENLNRSDAERVINELEDHDKFEFYHYIANNIPLNRFLTAGELNLFRNFRQESIYKLPRFIDFISPYFAERYGLALYTTFLNEDEAEFKSLITIQPLINSSHKEIAFGRLSNLIKEKVKEVDDLTNYIKNEESHYDENSVSEVFDWVQEQLKVDLINLLPAYFQSLRNQCAFSIRNLSVNVFNTFSDSALGLDIIGYALEFEIDGITKQRISDDYDKIEEINNDRIEEETNSPILQKYASILTGIKTKLDEIESISIVPHAISTWVSYNVKVNEINSLDDNFLVIKNEIALGLKALSIAVWNKFNDINVSLNLINLAYSINSDIETRNNILETRNQASEIKKKVDMVVAARQIPPKSPIAAKQPVKSESSTSNGCLSLFLIAFFVGIIVIAVNFEDFFGSSSKSQSSQSNTTNSSSSVKPTITEYSVPPAKVSAYKGNQLDNGASPFNSCFGQGVYSGEAWLQFENSNQSDAVVCLVNVHTSRTIRNEYIRAGSSFKMTKIPSGLYSLKVYYGNDWNPAKKNFCGTLGGFDTDEHFSKSDNPGDLIEIEHKEYSYTTGSITLYSVPGGNMTSEKASAADFFNN